MMDIKKLIISKISRQGELKAAAVVKATGFSRAYVSRFFQLLKDEGRIVLIGRANQARYVLADSKKLKQVQSRLLAKRIVLKNNNLNEDLVLSRLKKETGIWQNLSPNVSAILDYSFTEILNNAIEHSRSPLIHLIISQDSESVNFQIIDQGIGVFNSIRRKKQLKDNLEAIENLIKGKQTTAPKQHSGEGLFFTSKVADLLILKSSRKKLIFNNLINDVFIEDLKRNIRGTAVSFRINLKSRQSLKTVFQKYSDRSFIFSKTKVQVKLFEMDTGYISRSQARRVMNWLDKFKTVTLDFKGVKTVGQAFCDEVFRVWQSQHPRIEIIVKNANRNIAFMIQRAKKNNQGDLVSI